MTGAVLTSPSLYADETGNPTLPEHQFKGRREDLRLVTGRGRYTNDHHVDRPGRGAFPPRRPGACQDRADRHRGGAQAAGRARHRDRRRSRRGRLEDAAGAGVLQGRWRQFAARPVSPGAGAWPRPLRRRAGGAGDCRRPTISRRTPPNSSRSNTRTCRSWWTRAMRWPIRRSACTRRCPTIWRSNTSTATAAAVEQAFAKARSRRPRRTARAAHRRQSDGAEILHRAL